MNKELIKSLANNIIHGNRAVESTRQDHKEEAQELLSILIQENKKKKFSQQIKAPRFKSTFRIGLSGAPGVGKSSFIESFGVFLLSKGHNVAVLAVDPSSSRTGGSILGDKTRMPELTVHPRAYVRPSPSRGTLGGVARNTNEAVILCEAAGYDIILIETVGVGQSETMVADMVDMFVLLVAPGAGDELQGLKKGIVELSDLILVNKADGLLEVPARMAQIEYTSALKFVTPTFPLWKPTVLSVSSQEKKGFDKIWEKMKKMHTILETSNELESKRGRQRKKWMWQRISDELLWRLRNDKNVKDTIDCLEDKTYKGDITPGRAGDIILDKFIFDQHNKEKKI
ncbi:hypothetical protein HDU92_003298 [Lobulomyces angularis]|nr:hypothetical protein HDU92_003298 [Lobulomyces angularis]